MRDNRKLESLPLEQQIKELIYTGATPALITGKLKVSRKQVTVVRRSIERAGEGKKIQHQSRTRGTRDEQ